MYKLSIKRPVTTIMCMIIAIMGGLLGLSALNMDLMPTIDIPLAVVSTTYVGAGPEEMETLITKPIEEALGTVSNVDEITSTSSSNSSMVMVQFVDGTDVDMAAMDMREKIDLTKASLPDGANEPIVMKMDMNAMTAIVVGIHSEMEVAKLSTFLEENVTNQLERIEGVASVSLGGKLENEVQIILNPEKMAGYGVTNGQVSNVLAAENLNLPAGKISQGTTKMQIRSVGEFKSIEEIRNLPIATSSGALIHMRDIAEVMETTKDEDSYALIDGQKSIILIIQKQSNANIVDISEKITKQLDQISVQYPDISLTMLSNTADYIKTSVNNVLSTAVQAALMAMVILFIFLRNSKASLIIGVSIPTSVIITFAGMYLCNMTLNVVSLGGITIGIGMLVDNSVVVLECISRHHDNGMDAKTAAMVGTGEVAMSVAASTLTTLAVFIPMMFVKGTFGQMFKDLSLTITFALLASLLVALTFVPMACSRLYKYEETRIKNEKSILSRMTNRIGIWLDKLDNAYRSALKLALKHKITTVIIVVACFIGTLALIPVVGLDLMPSSDQGAASVNIEMPKGSVIEETTQIADQVIAKIQDIPEMKEWYAMVGGSMGGFGGGNDIATFNLNFVDKKDRKRSTDEIVRDVSERLEDIAGAKITVAASSSASGSYSSSSDVEFKVNGDSTEQLRAISNDLTKRIEDFSWASQVTTSLSDAVPEASVVINRVKAAPYGITASSLASAINTAVTGTTPTKYKVDGDEIDIRIMQDKDRIKFISDLQNLTVTAANGMEIPITEVADIIVKDGAVEITRSNQRKYITIGANTDGIDANSARAALTTMLEGYNFPEGYDYEFAGTLDSMVETFTSLLLVLVVAVALVYMIMAAQFESYLYPFVIMFSVPLGLTGGVLGLFLTGNTITATAFMGFIMLVGTVVNNAIVLVDYTNQLREKGMECDEALIEAGPTRLRPILMTTLTTVIGLLPMAISMAEGTEMQRPLAIVDIFGLAISTFITLLFVPVLYSLIDKMRTKSRKKRKPKNKPRKMARDEIVETADDYAGDVYTLGGDSREK